MIKKIAKWCREKAPAWMLRLEAKYPKTFWTVMAVLIILPFSPVTFAVLHWLSSMWAWMFTVK